MEQQTHNGDACIKEAFQALDKNNSGTLSWNELKGILEMQKKDVTPTNLDALFEILDKEQDGSITYDNFLTGYKKIFP